MSETKTPLIPFRIDMTCSKCNEGKMRPSNMTLLSNPPKYPHHCTKCDYEETYKVSYPYIDYEEAMMKPIPRSG
jgi:hypothetical protein